MSLQKNILEHISLYGTRTNSIRICRRNARMQMIQQQTTNDAKSTNDAMMQNPQAMQMQQRDSTNNFTNY